MADLRRCIGSAKFGIEAHEASPDEFPIQPSQKDGLGRMCKPHWNAYTTALRKAALARKSGDAGTPELPAREAPVGGRKGKVVANAEPAKAAPKARSGSALRRARRPADADHAAGSIADLTPVPDAAPEAEVAQEPASE